MVPNLRRVYWASCRSAGRRFVSKLRTDSQLVIRRLHRTWQFRAGRSTLASEIMRRALQLSVSVGVAAFIAFIGSMALVLGTAALGLNVDQKSAVADLALVVMAFLPSVVGAKWLFRKLQTMYSRREARAASIAFGVLTPIFVGLSMVFGEITGGYAEALGGRGFFILIGAFGGPFLLTAFLSLFVCALVLWITRLTMNLEQND